ncbi:MAG TPA: hypothetical protein VFV97_07380, partial [Rhodanobacteraceae bacterium]|nr:hypothetical protein [Rhodanobacteraceae bacterium]
MQRRHKEFLPRLVLATCAVVVALVGCSRPPDETRIRNAIAAMRESAEVRNAAGVLDHVGNDFIGQNGEIDRDGLARMLRIEFLRKDGFDVSIGAIAIEVDGDRATARFEMTVGDASRRWLPSGRETFAVVSGW